MASDQSDTAAKSAPEISVVVVVFNIPREAARTLTSLSSGYQRQIDANAYEVIVVDNGSDPPLDRAAVEAFGANFRLIRIDQASPSPAAAVNRGLAEARGDVIGVMIDGARIVTPGLIHFARHAARLHEKAVVVTLGWYLGYDFQWRSLEAGYDKWKEEALLESVAWPEDGYRLFEVGTMDESSVDGWFHPISESNALFLRREFWETLGGFEEQFDDPAGGLVNLDVFIRAVESPGAKIVILLGEATFHQLHGGTNTNSPLARQHENWTRWGAQYGAIRGRPWTSPQLKGLPTYIGTLPRPALLRFVRAATDPVKKAGLEPLGPDFQKDLWSLTSPEVPADSQSAALVALLHQELRSGHYAAAAGAARLIRQRRPNEPEPQRLLSLLGGHPPEPDSAIYQLAIAETHRILGEKELAISGYEKALALDGNLVQAHVGLATLRMPGDSYYVWLDRLYTGLSPETVVEIGVFDGASLALVRSPSLAIAIDPNPTVTYPLKAETHIFPETSDEFFAKDTLKSLLSGRPLGIGFIDGLHLYEQTLKDFINLEKFCGPRSVILFHDTVPLDEQTQTRVRNTQFHTGDVWKIVPCLKFYRPDLDIFTVATPWSGLTIVSGFGCESHTAFAAKYDEAVARFIDAPFSTIQSDMASALNLVANDWTVVRSHLRDRRIVELGPDVDK